MSAVPNAVLPRDAMSFQIGLPSRGRKGGTITTQTSPKTSVTLSVPRDGRCGTIEGVFNPSIVRPVPLILNRGRRDGGGSYENFYIFLDRPPPSNARRREIRYGGHCSTMKSHFSHELPRTPVPSSPS